MTDSRARRASAEQRGLGIRGEELAARHLVSAGLAVIERNVRLPEGEIDLVAREGQELVFVEVKTRIGDEETAPDTAVTSAKLDRLGRLAESYIGREGSPDVDWRVDVVAIVVARNGRLVYLDHIRGAYL